MGGGDAIRIHPVHPVYGDQGHQALGKLLNGLVKGLGGGVSVLAQDGVLGFEDALDGAHQGAPLTGQVGVDLALEVGLEQVAGADADAE